MTAAKEQPPDNRDYFEYMRTVLKAKNDPVYFIETILDQKLYPKQEEIVRQFYRNKYNPTLSQFKRLTLVAGMRCLAGNTRIVTDAGIRYIKEIPPITKVLTRNGFKTAYLLEKESEPTIKITTRYGYEIEGSVDHPILVMNKSGELKWVTLKDIQIGDYTTIYRIPCEYTPDCTIPNVRKLARFCGLLVGDGSYTITVKHRIIFTSGDDELKEEFIQLSKDLFNYTPHQIDDTLCSNTSTLYIHSKEIREYLLSVGLEYAGSYDKTIPYFVLEGSKEVQVEFLSGLYDTDGYILSSKNEIDLSLTSESIIRDVQIILLTFGIISSRKFNMVNYIKKDGSQSSVWDLVIYGKDEEKFIEQIGFRLPRNIRASTNTTAYRVSQVDKIPHLHSLLRRMKAMFPTGVNVQKWERIRHQCYNNLRKSTDKPSGITYMILDHIIDFFDQYDDVTDEVTYLKELRDKNLFYDEIVSIETGESKLYDLHVPDVNEFIANGIVSHNSGKTALASMLACFELFDTITIDNPSKHYGLLKNQPLFIITIATSSAIADDGVFSNCCNMIEGSDWFQTWGDCRVANDRINCDSKNVYFMVGGSWANTIIGRTVKCAIFDELDLFEATTGKRGAKNVYTSLSKSTATLGLDGHIIAISSPRSATGLMMSLYRDSLLDKEHSLAYVLPTWEMNPTQTRETLMIEYGNDMATFYRDFACQPEIAGELEFPEKVKLDKSIHNVLLDGFRQPTTERISRVMSIDPASINDGFGIATAYRNKQGNIVVDGAHLFKKEEGDVYIKPSDIEAFIYPKITQLNINAFVFDTWMFQNIIEDVDIKFGITPTKHIVKKENYDMWRGLQENRGDYGLNVVYHPVLERECNDLVIKQTNIPKVDHPFGGSKDLADAVCNCIWYLTMQEDPKELKKMGPNVAIVYSW